MSSDQAFELGQSVIYGCPWHGLVRNNRFTAPNGQHIDWTFSAMSARGSVRFAVPGVPAVTRTPEQVAADTTAGYQWRNDAAVMLRSSAQPLLKLYGAGFDISAHALYAAGPGNCWSVLLPSSMAMNGGRTQLLAPATLSAIGRLKLGGAPDEDVRSVPVTLSGYDQYSPSSGMVLLDALPDGRSAILGRVLFSGEQELFVSPFPATGFALMSVSGTGSEESPLAVNLELLSEPLERAGDSKVGGAPMPPPAYFFDRRIGPESDYTDEEDPDDEDDVRCADKRKDLQGASVTRISPTNDTREMELTGFVVGHWFNPSAGQVQAVTTDMRYKRQVQIADDYDVQAVVPAFFLTRYKWNATTETCEVEGDEDNLRPPVDVSYRWLGSSSVVTAEEIELALIVGGNEISRAKLRYEHEWLAAHNVLSPFAPGQGEIAFPVLPSGTLNRVERLYLNDHLVDELIHPASIAAPGNDIGSVKMLFDRANTFSTAAPEQWLPSVAQSLHSIADNRPAAGVRAQWLSNHLVCLREIVRGTNGSSPTGPATRNNYGPTAYPGGVSSAEFNSLAMVGNRIRPIYGARSPLTGALTLGQLDKIVYV